MGAIAEIFKLCDALCPINKSGIEILEIEHASDDIKEFRIYGIKGYCVDVYREVAEDGTIAHSIYHEWDGFKKISNSDLLKSLKKL